MFKSYSANIASTECFVTEPFARLAFLLIAVGVLTTQRLPAWREKKIVAHFDIHFRDLDCASSVVRYVELYVKGSHLFEL